MNRLIYCIVIYMTQSLAAIVSADSEESVSFNFRMISWGAEPLSGVALPINGHLEDIYAPIDQRSDELHYQGAQELVFYRHQPSHETTPIGKVTANEQWRDVLFLAQYNRAAEKLNLLAFDDSESAHPQDTIRLINLTGQPVGGIVGRQKILLKDDNDQTVPMSDRVGFIPVQFACHADGSAEWMRFLSTAIEARQGGRILMIFYPSRMDDLSGESEISFKLYYDSPSQQNFARLD